MSEKGFFKEKLSRFFKISKKESSRTGLFFGLVCSIFALFLFTAEFLTPLDNYFTAIFFQKYYSPPEIQSLVMIAKKDQATSELIQKNPGREEFASVFELLGQTQKRTRRGAGKARPFTFFSFMLGLFQNVREPIIRNSMVDFSGYTEKNLSFFDQNPQLEGYTSGVKVDSLLFATFGGNLLKAFAGPPSGPFIIPSLGLCSFNDEIVWIDLEAHYLKNQERKVKGLPPVYPSSRDISDLLDESTVKFENNRKKVEDLSQRWQMLFTKILKSRLAIKIDMIPSNLSIRDIRLASNLFLEIALVSVFDPVPADYFVAPASVIAFDFILQGEKNPEADLQLRNAIAASKSKVVLAAYTKLEEEYLKDYNAYEKATESMNLAELEQKRLVTRVILPDSKFLTSDTRLGMIDISAGDKNLVTQVPLFIEIPERRKLEPALSLITAMLALDNIRPEAATYSYVDEMQKSLQKIYPEVASGKFAGPLKILDQEIPVDAKGRLYLRFAGSTQKNKFKRPAFPSVSFFECFSPEHLQKFKIGASEISQSRLKRAHNRILNYGPNSKGGKVVMVGPFEMSDMDFYPTPLSMRTPFTVQNEPLMGIEIHANAVLNILQGDYLRHPNQRHTLFATIITSLLLGILLDFISPFSGAVMTLLFMSGITWFGSYSYNQLGQVFYISSMFISYPVIWALATLTNYLRQRARAQNTKDMFSRFVAADVVQYMLENPELVKPGGQKVELTIFFSDVAGFTSISEALTPEELVVLLNEYLGAMTDLLFEYGGTLDKFIGDAVMAFWNYPCEQEDHAEKACLCALAMQRKIHELQLGWAERGLPNVSARAGLNTAGVVVGYMGSNKAQMNFTCMGDGVNLASRLEGANKEYGTAMMISDATYQKAKNKITVRFLDFLAVKGKKEPVKVFELVCEKGKEPPDWDELHKMYDHAIQLHLDRKWDEAIAAFEQILLRWPDDGPSQTYLKRCHEYIQQPPPDDWDGRYILTHK